MEMGNLGQVHNIVQDGCVLNELNTNGWLSLHVGERFPYAPYGTLVLPDDKKSKHEMEMDLQNHHIDYQVPSTMELSRPLFDNGHHDWSSEPSSYGLSIYHGNSFNQAHDKNTARVRGYYHRI